MAKFSGEIGFADTVEKRPGVWMPDIVPKHYYGDVTRNTRRLDSSGQVNEGVNISNEISIVADPYANQNFHKMRYVKYMGTKWRVTGVEVQYPRLILTIGGEYNGEDED